jgi:hypothetical protein
VLFATVMDLSAPLVKRVSPYQREAAPTAIRGTSIVAEFVSYAHHQSLIATFALLMGRHVLSAQRVLLYLGVRPVKQDMPVYQTCLFAVPVHLDITRVLDPVSHAQSSVCSAKAAQRHQFAPTVPLDILEILAILVRLAFSTLQELASVAQHKLEFTAACAPMEASAPRA